MSLSSSALRPVGSAQETLGPGLGSWAPLTRRPVPSLPLVLEILQLALVRTAEGAPPSFSVVLHGVVPGVLKAVVC